MTDSAVDLMPASSRPVVILHTRPSQVVNLPRVVESAVALAVLGVASAWASTRWPLAPIVAIAPALLCLLRVALAYLRTAFTEIIIDSERITCRQGILNKEVSSLELFRIQDVTSLHPWWQRLFNVGTVAVMTSDSNNPRWRLPGIVNAEQMRGELNRAAIALRDRKGIREVNMGRV